MTLKTIHSTHIKEFNEKGFTLIKNAVSRDVIEIVSSYALLKEAYAFSQDNSQVKYAHAVYCDFLMESLLLEYRPIVEQATGLELFPTYSFYRVYRRGQELVPHTDRESCEISISVCYNYDYMGEDYEWPLYMEQTPVVMEPGDITVYRGCDLSHWRPVFSAPEDSYHIQSFYHYVDRNGPYTEYAYDSNKGSHLKMLEKIRGEKYE